MSGSQWYFHIDTSIDDGASGTSHIDQLKSDTFQTVWRRYLCVMGITWVKAEDIHDVQMCIYDPFMLIILCVCVAHGGGNQYSHNKKQPVIATLTASTYKGLISE